MRLTRFVLTLLIGLVVFLPSSKGSLAAISIKPLHATVTIRATSSAWVELVTDSGAEILAQLMSPGDSYSIVNQGNTYSVFSRDGDLVTSTKERIYLSTGNAAGLELALNNQKPFSLGGVGEIIRDHPLEPHMVMPNQRLFDAELKTLTAVEKDAFRILKDIESNPHRHFERVMSYYHSSPKIYGKVIGLALQLEVHLIVNNRFQEFAKSSADVLKVFALANLNTLPPRKIATMVKKRNVDYLNVAEFSSTEVVYNFDKIEFRKEWFSELLRLDQGTAKKLLTQYVDKSCGAINFALDNPKFLSVERLGESPMLRQCLAVTKGHENSPSFTDDPVRAAAIMATKLNGPVGSQCEAFGEYLKNRAAFHNNFIGALPAGVKNEEDNLRECEISNGPVALYSAKMAFIDAEKLKVGSFNSGKRRVAAFTKAFDLANRACELAAGYGCGLAAFIIKSRPVKLYRIAGGADVQKIEQTTARQLAQQGWSLNSIEAGAYLLDLTFSAFASQGQTRDRKKLFDEMMKIGGPAMEIRKHALCIEKNANLGDVLSGVVSVLGGEKKCLSDCVAVRKIMNMPELDIMSFDRGKKLLRRPACTIDGKTQSAPVQVQEAKPGISSAELLTAQRKAEQLEQQLADLRAKQKQQKQTISNDTKVPTITIASASSNGPQGTVKGRVTDNTGIAEVRVDGRLVGVDKAGNFMANTYVPEGGVSMSIQAIDLAGLSSSMSVRIDRAAVQTAAFRFDRLNPLGRKVAKNKDAVAIIVGVSDYKETAARAAYADSDATVFKDYAIEKLGVPRDRIKTLVNDGADEKDMLLAVKRWLARASKRDKTDVYVFFAGHGLASDDGQKMYLLPYDGAPELLDDTAILRDRLFSDIASANPRSVTVFLDTCYSGTTRGTDMLIASRPIAIKALKQSVPDNFTVMTAARGDQTAKPLEEAKHGMFSYFLMKGMEGEADSNQDNKITAGELHQYVQSNVVQQSSGSQTPELQGDAERVLVRFQ